VFELQVKHLRHDEWICFLGFTLYRSSIGCVGDKVLIKVKDAEKSEGGIVLPSTAQTKPHCWC